MWGNTMEMLDCNWEKLENKMGMLASRKAK